MDSLLSTRLGMLSTMFGQMRRGEISLADRQALTFEAYLNDACEDALILEGEQDRRVAQDLWRERTARRSIKDNVVQLNGREQANPSSLVSCFDPDDDGSVA